MTGAVALPEPCTLPALQDYVARMVEVRGFTQDVERVFVLWVEELGELAEQLADSAPADALALGAELADVTLYLADLANGLRVNLEQSIGAALPGPVPRPGAGAPLSAWQACAAGPAGPAGPPEPAEASAQRAVLGLLAAAGQVARVLRKRWSGREGDGARPLADALGHVLRLANRADIDLTRAIADKERENAGRVWSY